MGQRRVQAAAQAAALAPPGGESRAAIEDSAAPADRVTPADSTRPEHAAAAVPTANDSTRRGIFTSGIADSSWTWPNTFPTSAATC